MTRAPFYLISLFLVLPTPAILADCPYQACSCTGRRIDCRYSRFQTIPELNTQDSEGPWELEFNANRLKEVQEHSLPANLVRIDFRDNPLETIALNAFQNSSSTLENLYFRGAKFTRLPQALLNLNNLRILDLHDTIISEWDNDVVLHLGHTLQELTLHRTGLVSWPDWLSQFSVLTALEISYAPITNVPQNALHHVNQSLTDLKLDNLNLSSVPTAIKELTSLEYLSLSDNDIDSTVGLPTHAKIETLHMIDNKISDISQLVHDLLPYGNTMTFLFLTGNQLTAIPDLSHMVKLEYVDLSYNQIADPDSGSFCDTTAMLSLNYNYLQVIPKTVLSMSGIKRLYLSSNAITTIHSSAIPLQLLYLTLDRNQITELSSSSFPQNSSLTNLWLKENPITKISNDAFENLVQLIYLDMQDTKLTRVPLALSSLTNLNTLSMENSADLVCTCQESELASWFQAKPSMVIKGDCGDTTLSYFFFNLAGQCSNSP